MMPFPYPLILVLCVFLPSFLLSVISLTRHFSNIYKLFLKENLLALLIFSIMCLFSVSLIIL